MLRGVKMANQNQDVVDKINMKLRVISRCKTAIFFSYIRIHVCLILLIAYISLVSFVSTMLTPIKIEFPFLRTIILAMFFSLGAGVFCCYLDKTKRYIKHDRAKIKINENIIAELKSVDR